MQRLVATFLRLLVSELLIPGLVGSVGGRRLPWRRRGHSLVLRIL